MIALILLVLLLTPAWSFAQETEETKKEPPLAELGRRERERRANMKEVGVITNADLKNMKGLVSTGGRPPTAASEGTGEGESGLEEYSEDGEKDPEAWRALFDEARLDLKNAVNRSLVLQLKMNYLRNTWLREDDGTTQARIQQQLQETLGDIESSPQEIQAAREALQALQSEAQQEGLLPGTIRELVGELPQGEGILTSLGR
ncbi:hypothetical protein MYX78_12180 [Acidobacteria bacterium AH-259-G07]|nr:hypothetical protein [Acidobacteria bacterium AH-259-G07]